MANYCTHCGTVLHPRFSLCPHCNRERLNGLIYSDRVQSFGAFTAAPQPQSVSPGTQSAAIPIPQAPKVVEKTVYVRQERKHKPIYKGILTILLTVVLLAVSLSAMGIMGIRQATTAEALTDIAESAEISDILSLLGTNGKNRLYDALKTCIAESTGKTLSNTKINKMLDKAGYPGYLGEKAAIYAEDLYEGSDRFTMGANEVFELLLNKREALEAIAKTTLSDDVLEQMAGLLTNQELVEKISTASLREHSPRLYYPLHYGLSYGAVGVLVLIAALLCFVMTAMDFSMGVLGTGMALTVSGGLFALPALLAKLFPAALKGITGNSLLQAAITGFLEEVFLISALVFVAGLALLLLRSVILLLCRACK